MSQSNIPQISADEVQKSMSDGSEVVLLDVRTSGEYSRGKIEGSINIPVDEIPSKVEVALPDKNKSIYVYCLSGARSDAAVDIMQKLGYTSVFSMTSGLLMWRAKKFPLSTL